MRSDFSFYQFKYCLYSYTKYLGGFIDKLKLSTIKMILIPILNCYYMDFYIQNLNVNLIIIILKL